MHTTGFFFSFFGLSAPSPTLLLLFPTPLASAVAVARSPPPPEGASMVAGVHPLASASTLSKKSIVEEQAARKVVLD